MKIALYYPWIYLRSGVERTILELTKRSRHQWTIFTSHFDGDSTYPEFKKRKIIELKKVPVSRSYTAVLKAAVTILSQKIDLREYNALWVHSEGLGDLITVRNHERPVICFCHTPMKVIHDPLARKAYLERNRCKKPFFALFSALFRFIDRSAWRNYNHVFSVSEEVKNRILKAGLAVPRDIEVVYRGVDTEEIRPTWKYEPYFFHPARIKWWKNVELSINAFMEFQGRFPDFNDFDLMIAGQVDKGSKAYYERILDMARANSHIKIIPDPSEEMIKDLYESSYAVLNTTLNEDWGLVPLEAMAYGKPVIAVNQGGPKESIVDKKTGFLAEPTPEAFAAAMKRLAEDRGLLLKMGKDARAHSLGFEWGNFIRKIDDYLDRL